MAQLPHTDDDRRRMLEAIGASEEELFSFQRDFSSRIVPALSEEAILDALAPLAVPLAEKISGLGVGPFPIPAVVDAVTSRGEFVTAYTPYQPECSQGTLESIFEFQTRVCEMTGLDVANAGLYDGSTACVEAVSAAMAETGRKEVLVARSLAPRTREVMGTALAARGAEFREVPFDLESGECDEPVFSEKTAALVIQSPNVFGVLEPHLRELFSSAKSAGAVPIQVFHPLAVAMFDRPGDVGAEIAVAEGQPLGIPLWGGGPWLGLFAATKRFLRRVPGRITGRTVDADGREAYVLTLQTREQHIRREKATSNICSNQALMALRATVFLAALGDDGLRELAGRIHEKAKAAAKGRALFSGEIFNEYTVKGTEGIPLPYPELGTVSVRGIAR